MKNLILLFIGLSLLSLSCKKFIEIDSPKNQLTPDKVFADSADANGAIAGIYINMMQAFTLGFSSGGVTAYPGLSADELYQTTTDVNTEFYANNVSPNNATISALWTSAYNFIYGTNACIEGIEGSTNISASQKGRLMGEAKFIRAFLYFNLINLYGAVPLITTTDYQSNRLKDRTSVNLVYDQIIADLKFAQLNLGSNATLSERANTYAATALLAKVYLFKEDYALAQTEADKVINSGKYKLMEDLNAVFIASSRETIWRFLPVYPGRETWEGYYFVPSSSTVKPKYILTDNLFKSFEPGDQRKIKWVNTNSVSGSAFPYPYKYKKGSTTGVPGESYVIFRLSEQYLIRAEARAHLEKLTGTGSAAEDVNTVRLRAGLTDPTSATTAAEMMTAIEKERRAELFCEWGNRWFDLKRTGRANDVLSPQKTGWKAAAALYPIPQTELNADPNLTQNPEY